MLLNHICSRFKAIFLGFLTIFNRALCCFSRKRRNSFSDCEVLQSVNVITNEYSSSKKRNEVSRVSKFTNFSNGSQTPPLCLDGSRLELLGWFTKNRWRTHRTLSPEIGAIPIDWTSRTGRYRFLSGTCAVFIYFTFCTLCLHAAPHFRIWPRK